VLEVVHAAEKVAGRQVPYEMAPRRAGDPSTTYADPSFAERTLGWKAGQQLDEIVRTAYDWHVAQLGGER
jgi:UDP-glucose 4-epimerase